MINETFIFGGGLLFGYSVGYWLARYQYNRKLKQEGYGVLK